MLSTSAAIGLTSRSRLTHLERDLSSLRSAVHRLEAKLGSMPVHAAAGPPPLPQEECLNAPASQDTCSDLDSDVSDPSPTNPPAHLLQLFDNGLLGADVSGSDFASRHAPALHKAQRNSALRELMPSGQDMITIAGHAASWLPLYNSLFPSTNLTKGGAEMLSQWDDLQDPDADPLALSSLLLSIALTVQLAPHATTVGAAKTIKDAPSFIKDVSDTVEHVVVSDDALAGTLEGMETILLFIRL